MSFEDEVYWEMKATIYITQKAVDEGYGSCLHRRRETYGMIGMRE